MTLYQIRLEWKTFSVIDYCIFWHLKQINYYYYYYYYYYYGEKKTQYGAVVGQCIFRCYITSDHAPLGAITISPLCSQFKSVRPSYLIY